MLPYQPDAHTFESISARIKAYSMRHVLIGVEERAARGGEEVEVHDVMKYVGKSLTFI